MKKKILAFLLLSLCSQLIFGQRYTISGTITDASNGELLPYSTIIDSVSKKGTLANYYGFYSIKLDKGPVKIMCSYAGFNPSIISFNLTKDTTINLTINSTTEIEEIVVTSSTNKLRSTQMGLVEIPIQETKQLPVLLGEADLMKTIQLMPGIKGGTEGTSGIYVRGGGPDQNLILLDGVPVYNASHAFGVFSVFNSDAIQSFNLMKGGFPARYGGRLSSVIDIKMKEGNNKEFHGEGSIGIISSKLTLEGPIKKEQSSFLISARRTYFDLFTVPITMAASDGKNVGGYYFYDVNAKVNHKFSEKSRLFLSFYTGLDKVYMREKSSYEGNTRKNEAGTGWGNITTALRWNYILSDNLFANFTGTFSQYKFFIEEESNNSNNNDFFSYQYNSGIVDYAAKIDFDYIPHAAHNIKFGTNSIIHTFNPGVNVQKENGGNNNIDTTFGNKNIYATEISSYIEDDIEFSPKFKANIGLHYSFFSVRSRTYNSFQPRLSGRYLLNNNIALKASYIQMMQYIHLLTNSTIGLPTDLWVPSTPNIKPQEAWQTALGTEISLNKGYSLSVEGYYKEMKNLIEYKEGASF
ncbi:MAG TPA: TonB-dependent receptor, partial [Bacteroidales bacterium]